jgi:hypothetical protein
VLQLNVTLTNEQAERLEEGLAITRQRTTAEMNKPGLRPEREEKLAQIYSAVSVVYQPVREHLDALARLDQHEKTSRRKRAS